MGVSFQAARSSGGVDPRELQGVVREILSSGIRFIVGCFYREVGLDYSPGFTIYSRDEYLRELRVSLVFWDAFSFLERKRYDEFRAEYSTDRYLDVHVVRDRGTTRFIDAFVVVRHLDSRGSRVDRRFAGRIFYLPGVMEKGAV